MTLQITVHDTVSVADVLLGALQNIVRQIVEMISSLFETSEEVPSETEKKQEDTTAPPALGINIIDTVRTGEALG